MKNSVMAVTAAMLLALAALAGRPAAAPDPGNPNPVRTMIRRLELGRPVTSGSLTIVPVYLDMISDRTPYATLDDALKNGWIAITEVAGGRVPQVKISNLSKRVIFLMGGEILTGCRQDRILAGDILLGPGTRDLLAPVFCVEQGRWTHVSESFFSKQNLGTPALRARAQEKSPGAQSRIWGRIAEENRSLGVASPTGAYQDAYEKEENRARIEGIETKMKDVPSLHAETVGAVIGLGGEIVSVDIFANPGLFLKQWPKILRASALSSLGAPGDETLSRDEAALFLRSFLDREYRSQAGLDLGVEYSSIDSSANIQALAHTSGLLHLSGFPQEEDRIKVIEDDRGPADPRRRLR